MTRSRISAQSLRSDGVSEVTQLPWHLPSLDGVRGLAILLVLMHNLLILGDSPIRFVQRVGYALNAGWIGVDLFFVLSGFLITRILLETQEAPNYYRAFFARRVLRIFPLSYAVLIVVFVLWPAFATAPTIVTHDRSLWLWLYVSNWTTPLGLGGDSLPHFWSLAVEEQFYLIWPFLVRRRSAKQVLQLCLVLALLSVGLRAALVAQAVSPELVYTVTLCRFDSLGLGGALAAVIKLPGALPWLVRWRGRILVSAALVALVGLVITHGYPRTTAMGQTLGYTLLAIVFTLGIAAALGDECTAGTRWLSWLRAAPLRAMGRYSYAMYIFHRPLHYFVGKPLLQAMGLTNTQSLSIALGYLVVGTLASVLAGGLSYHLFEKHFLALKDRFAAVTRS